jgi:hypothetical protein
MRNVVSDSRRGHRLAVFENSVLRIFGPRRDGLIGSGGKLQNEELNNMYASLTIIRMTR